MSSNIFVLHNFNNLFLYFNWILVWRFKFLYYNIIDTRMGLCASENRQKIVHHHPHSMQAKSSYEERHTATSNQNQTENFISSLFDKFDSNKDGYLQKDEL